MKYGDKRDKDLNTNEEGLKYAVDTSNAYCDLNKDEYERINKMQRKLHELGMMRLEGRCTKQGSNKQCKNYQQYNEYLKEKSKAMRDLLHGEDLDPEVENRLRDEYLYQKQIKDNK